LGINFDGATCDLNAGPLKRLPYQKGGKKGEKKRQNKTESSSCRTFGARVGARHGITCRIEKKKRT